VARFSLIDRMRQSTIGPSIDRMRQSTIGPFNRPQMRQSTIGRQSTGCDNRPLARLIDNRPHLAPAARRKRRLSFRWTLLVAKCKNTLQTRLSPRRHSGAQAWAFSVLAYCEIILPSTQVLRILGRRQMRKIGQRSS
jgi:hypothetical protein